MKLFRAATVLVLSALLPSIWAEASSDATETDPKTPSDVITLTAKTFDDVVKKEELVLVKFYAPWCGFCKKIAPHFETAATSLKEDNIKLAKLDCTEPDNEPVCSKHEVRGFPTLKIFRNGDASEYSGPRESDGIISFMKRQTLPPVSEVTKENAAKFIASEDVVVVGFFDAKSKQYTTFENVAKKLRDKFVFGAAVSADLAKEHGVTVPGVVLFKTFDEKKAIYSKKEITEEDLMNFVKVESKPVMDEIGPDNYMDYMDSPLPLGYFFYENKDQRQSIGSEIEKVAKDFKGKVNFVYIDAEKFGGHSESVGLNATWPAFAITDTKEGLKYPFDQSKDITEKAIRSFVKDLVDGKLEPSYKSAPVPDNTGKPVVEIVHSTFLDIAHDKEKDVFVKFYAPWCGHCKSLAPIWEKLGKHLTDAKSNIVIAKFDATENDLPKGASFEIQGFPTLKLFKAETNEIVEFSGERNLASLVKFLKKNAVHNEIEDIPEEEKKTDDEESEDKEESEVTDDDADSTEKASEEKDIEKDEL